MSVASSVVLECWLKMLEDGWPFTEGRGELIVCLLGGGGDMMVSERVRSSLCLWNHLTYLFVR